MPDVPCVNRRAFGQLEGSVRVGNRVAVDIGMAAYQLHPASPIRVREAITHDDRGPFCGQRFSARWLRTTQYALRGVELALD